MVADGSSRNELGSVTKNKPFYWHNQMETDENESRKCNSGSGCRQILDVCFL